MKLTDKDVQKIVDQLPMGLMELMVTEDIFLAGGAIRAIIAGEEVKDFDLFTRSAEKAREYAERLSEVFNNEDYLATENAFTVKDDLGSIPDIQFIHRWTFSNKWGLIGSFDYTIAQAAIWFENGDWKSVATPSFYDDLEAKQLVYTAPDREEEPGGSLLRMRKFLRMGYDISSYDMAKVISRLLNGVDLNQLADFKENERSSIINDLLTDAYGKTINDK